jgi:DNA invertase Pin-like site-specific DNA recombinase
MGKSTRTSNGDGPDLTGTGAAYIRVSDDAQDTARQYASAHAFEKRHGVTIPKHNWFKDEAWARDTADRRPDFQRLLKEVEAGRVQWIVVDQLDRFGTKNAKQLISYLHRLDEAGCKLYDAAGKEWTGEDVATIITAVVEGEKSKGEQTGKSHRVLGGKVAKARAGEWQGGPVRLGFDVGCYSRATGKELWRVVIEGRHKRLKVYPDGRTERFDGKGNFPAWQCVGKPSPEFLRLAPSKDRAKIDAAVTVFRQYATEAIGHTAVAHWLNGLGFRNGGGGHFQGQQIEAMLADPIYLGYYAWNRTHCGKFGRYAGGQVVEELNYDEQVSRNDEADWVQSDRLFPPLVDQKTWDAVQRKLARQRKRTNAPRSAAQYLAGLVYCGNCGGRMVTGALRKTAKHPRKDGHTGPRHEYFCGTYFKAARNRWLAVERDGVVVRIKMDKDGRPTGEECKCLRNGVFQDELEVHVERYLDHAGQRLEVLTEGLGDGHIIGRLEGQEEGAWRRFLEGLYRVCTYLIQHHPAEYAALVDESNARRATSDEQVDMVAACYRANFDPAALAREAQELDERHTQLYRRYADLKTPLARQKADAELADLEARIEELRAHRHDAAELVAAQYREVYDLQLAIADARAAMRADSGERALRRRAEKLRAIIQRIECNFVATGKTGSGYGKKNSKLAAVTFYPVVGDPVTFWAARPVVGDPAASSAGPKGTLQYVSAHSFKQIITMDLLLQVRYVA